MAIERPRRPARHLLLTWATGLIVVTAGAVAWVKHEDQDNRFCVACHLHEDIYRRTLAAPAGTLAAAHSGARGPGHPERCFTCHSGEGVLGWTQVTLLSAWDAARWVAGDRHEPTSMRLPIENAACLKCHAADIRAAGRADASALYHQLSDHRAEALPCVACHVVHAAGEKSSYFLDNGRVRGRCQGCHRDFGAD